MEILLDYCVYGTSSVEDQGGWTALHFACWDGHLSKVEKLLSSGCDKEARTSNGSTPLHLCCSSVFCYDVHLSIVKLLVSSGANVSAVNKAAQTPLQTAEKWLPRDSGLIKENRSRIISHMKGLIENSSVAAGNSASNITDSATAVADNDHPSN